MEEQIKRTYHHYDKWEDYKHGFYDNISGRNKKELMNRVVELFSDSELTKVFMSRVIKEWKYSCEHNLSNLSMNRIAYLGQAACCLYGGVPHSITMEAWSLVDKNFRDEADIIANKLIQEWEVNYAKK